MDLIILKGEITGTSYQFIQNTISGVTYNSTTETYTKDGFHISLDDLNSKVFQIDTNKAFIVCETSELTVAKSLLEQHFYKVVQTLIQTFNQSYIITEDLAGI
jgi:hypothetical protein